VRLGKSKIHGVAEALLDAVVLIRGQQFESPQNAQFIEQVAAHPVLSALTPVQGKQQRGSAFAAGFEGEHSAVFVVRMGRGVHQAGRGIQPQQHLLEARLSCVLGQQAGTAALIG
jgi:hypothetical protein